ncbi:MAG: biopolymer transporter ExbB [Cycloclasticus sp. symbiont of Poecilosclerida sp. N]|nr:MAG: biopolymer transporter ExbB [Cycloclasticus sp. symbiont of Poecilosclerida sp. N]
MELGGVVLWFIFVLLSVMWTLIFERIWYYKMGLQKELDASLSIWNKRPERKSKRAHQVRDKLLSQISIRINQYLPLIKTLVALSPLFGLLGTVTGMISVFETMAITGGGDAKAMSSGVSMATIPTMAGMVTALSGVFGFTYIQGLAKKKKRLLENRLTLE